MAEVIEFPDCCGLIIINKLKGGHPSSDPNDCIKEDALDVYLTKQEQNYYNKRAGLVAVLSESQEDQIGHVFRERKWVALMEGITNPRTGSKLFMYFRNLNPTEARRKRIFGK